MTQATPGVIMGEFFGVKTDAGPWSVPVSIQMPMRPSVLAAPG